MSTSSGWIRVSKAAPCLVCGKPDFCTITADGAVCKCTRIESERPIQNRDGQPSWLHVACKLGTYDLAKANRPAAMVPRLKLSEVKTKIKEFRQNMTKARLTQCAHNLGLPERSIEAFGVGYCYRPDSLAFPMFGGDGKPCGIRLRRMDGEKKCVPGSRNGLFIAADFEPQAAPDAICEETSPLLLLLPEGATDAIAAHALGFAAIGRPSNAGGAQQLAELLGGWTVKFDVVVVADHDEAKYRPNDPRPFWPGIEGALRICEQIKGVCSRLRFMLPPDGAKDLRAWAKTGSSCRLLEWIIASSTVNDDWLRRAHVKVEMNRKRPVATQK